MKTVNSIKILSVIILVGSFQIGCSKKGFEQNTIEKEYLTSLSFSGEITTELSPLSMTRGSTSSEDVYGINVLEDGKYYAFGVFDNIDDMKIYLRANHTYKFIATCIPNSKSSYYSSEYHKYVFNFYGCLYSLENVFSYYSDYLGHIIGRSPSHSSRRWDRFYGELDNYEATENGTANIELIRTSYGLRYEISGITDGIVSICISISGEQPIESSHDSNYISDNYIISSYSPQDTWKQLQEGKVCYEYATITCRWESNGITQDLGEIDVSLECNKMNIIRLKLNDYLSASTSSNNTMIELENIFDMNGENSEYTLQ